MTINLFDLVEHSQVFGNPEGQVVFQKLQKIIAEDFKTNIFGISLKGIEATDASFPRESVVSIAKMYKGEKGFYLCDFANQDLIDNWKYAADAKQQPLIVKEGKNYTVIGTSMTESASELLDFIMKKKKVTSSLVADKFGISVQNASAKLKKLLDQGLILGSKEAAESGGLEFVFTAIE